MPVCFQLCRRDDGQPAVFQQIDAAICQNLDLPFDDTKYTCEWYDRIGLRLALGHSFQQITDEFAKYETQNSASMNADRRDYYRNIIRINHYLQEHYTADNWREIGRHA